MQVSPTQASPVGFSYWTIPQTALSPFLSCTTTTRPTASAKLKPNSAGTSTSISAILPLAVHVVPVPPPSFQMSRGAGLCGNQSVNRYHSSRHRVDGVEAPRVKYNFRAGAGVGDGVSHDAHAGGVTAKSLA